MTLDAIFQMLDGDEDLCWILVGDELSEKFPNFIEAACLAVSFANDYRVEATYPTDVATTSVTKDTANQRRSKSNQLRQLFNTLRAREDLTFSLLWQVRGSETDPQLVYSKNLTVRQAWQSIVGFLQHDIEWTIGELVG